MSEQAPAIVRMTEINMEAVRNGVDLLDMARQADDPGRVLAYSEHLKVHLDKVSYWARSELISSGGEVWDEEGDLLE